MIILKVFKKSVSISKTFKAITQVKEYEDKICELADGLEQKLKIQKTVGKTMTLGFMDTRFIYKEKSKSLAQYIQSKEDIIRYSFLILHE